MKFLNKIFLALGLVAVIAQPAKAEFQDVEGQNSIGSTLFYGALGCGAAGLAKACQAATYTFIKPTKNKQNVYTAKSPLKLFMGHGQSSHSFRKNFGEAVICGALAYGLYALSMSYLKTA